jgi:hypothetical protein
MASRRVPIHKSPFWRRQTALEARIGRWRFEMPAGSCILAAHQDFWVRRGGGGAEVISRRGGKADHQLPLGIGGGSARSWRRPLIYWAAIGKFFFP